MSDDANMILRHILEAPYPAQSDVSKPDQLSSPFPKL